MSRSHETPSGLEATEQAGLLWSWWRGDPLVPLPPLDGLHATAASGNDVVQRLSGLDAGALDESGDLGGAATEAPQEETEVGRGHRQGARAVPALQDTAWRKMTSHWPTLPFYSDPFNAKLNGSRRPSEHLRFGPPRPQP